MIFEIPSEVKISVNNNLNEMRGDLRREKEVLKGIEFLEEEKKSIHSLLRELFDHFGSDQYYEADPRAIKMLKEIHYKGLEDILERVINGKQMTNLVETDPSYVPKTDFELRFSKASGSILKIHAIQESINLIEKVIQALGDSKKYDAEFDSDLESESKTSE